MPTTRENVAEIHRRNPKYSVTEILGFLNEVHMRCVEQELDQFVYIDPVTGRPPYLVTTPGQYVYNAPDNCRKTWMIAIDIISNYDYLRYYSSTNILQTIASQEQDWCGKTYLKLPYITQRDRLDGAAVPAQVIFGGAHHSIIDGVNALNKLHHFYWIKANPIETIDDEMQIPDNLHFEIRRAISAYMSTEDYGESGSDENMIELCVKKIRNKLARGAKGRIGQTKFQLQDRDF